MKLLFWTQQSPALLCFWHMNPTQSNSHPVVYCKYVSVNNICKSGQDKPNYHDYIIYVYSVHQCTVYTVHFPSAGCILFYFPPDESPVAQQVHNWLIILIRLRQRAFQSINNIHLWLKGQCHQIIDSFLIKKRVRHFFVRSQKTFDGCTVDCRPNSFCSYLIVQYLKSQREADKFDCLVRRSRGIRKYRVRVGLYL